MTYDNTNSGFIMRAKEKPTEKHPDYKGLVNVNGTDFEVAGWKKTSKAGEPYLSLKIQPPFKKTKAAPKVEAAEGFDDEIPF